MDTRYRQEDQLEVAAPRERSATPAPRRPGKPRAESGGGEVGSVSSDGLVYVVVDADGAIVRVRFPVDEPCDSLDTLVAALTEAVHDAAATMRTRREER